jgi:histidine triad (HIT) family protein
MSQAACIFCRIAKGEAPARIAYEDDSCIAFHDIHPMAPVHILVIPRKHLASVDAADESAEAALGHLHRVAAQLAQEHQLTAGHRVVMNTGAAAGQSVFHIHLHLLGGRPFRWPPG